jgi:hypothetical protein
MRSLSGYGAASVTGRNRTSAREIKRLQRRAEVYRWRIAGHSIRYISQHLHIGTGTVQRDIDATMTAVRDRLADRCQSELMLTLERLDEYQSSMHEKAKSGDREAIETCLRVENQRARLLHPTSGGASTAVNVNVGGKSDNNPNLEWKMRYRDRIIEFVDSRHQNEPAAIDVTRLSKEQHQDAASTHFPRRIEHQLDEYAFKDGGEPAPEASPDRQAEPPSSAGGQFVKNGALDGWGNRKQWKRQW